MTQEIADGVHQQRLAHSKVVYLEDERLLVDTGPETEWDALHEFIETTDGVDSVFLSHAHGDHYGNIQRVLETYDPAVYCPAGEPLDETPLADDDVTRVEDGEYVGDGVRVVIVRGHTPGIAALYLEDHEVLLATDVLDGSDRRGLPAGHLLPPPALYNWDAADAELNLEKLLELEFETAVVTHGSNIESGARDKLDAYLNFPEHYRADLLAQQD